MPEVAEEIAEMFEFYQGCFDAKHDHLGLRVVTKYNAGAFFEQPPRGRDMTGKRIYERERMQDPAKRSKRNEERRRARKEVAPFLARLKKARLTKHVRMICHGRDIPEDVLGIVRGATHEERMARMDLCFYLHVSRGWSPARIAELLGDGFIVGDVCAWLSGRGIVVDALGTSA